MIWSFLYGRGLFILDVVCDDEVNFILIKCFLNDLKFIYWKFCGNGNFNILVYSFFIFVEILILFFKNYSKIIIL